MILANLNAIFRRELQGYFASPLAYCVATIFWLLSGFFFVSILLDPQEGLMRQVAVIDQGGMEMPPIDLAYEFLRIFFGVMGSLVLFVLPMLSMGLYAEERKRGTLELLVTSPIPNWVVALGKLLGVTAFFAALILPLLLYEAIVFAAAEPPIPPQVPLLAHLGLLLLAASILSLGMFVSSLTESTLLAAVLTFALVLLLWAIDLVGNQIGGGLGAAIAHISLLSHYNNLIEGIFDLGSIVLFASYIVLGLFLTAQSVDTLRHARR